MAVKTEIFEKYFLPKWQVRWIVSIYSNTSKWKFGQLAPFNRPDGTLKIIALYKFLFTRNATYWKNVQ